jgi:alkanesulfonate monooxygenase SsuD/methylene tetrahydromethanopterin reductase-like flavin-dependent oxidoreductase (luciferase family)
LPKRYSQAMKIGVAIGGSLQEVGILAARAEAAGLESVWLAELDRTALVQAAAAISATSRIGVGTAVALAFPRSPTVTAMTAWDLDEMSGDRFMLGLGPQVRRVLEARFSVRVDKPAPQMREYVRAVRTVWAANRGEAVTHEGEAYRITMPTFHGPPRPDRRDTPILLAAVGPAMSRVCGDVADGLLGHPLASPRYLREAVQPWVDAGLERSSRSAGASPGGASPGGASPGGASPGGASPGGASPGGASPAGASPAGASPAGASPAGACPITAMALVSLGDDADAARRAARLQIAFYATTPSYKSILELHDRGSLPRDLRRAFVNRDLDRMAELIDDELLDAIAISGRPDEAADRLRAWEGVADRVVLGVPWYGMEADRQREAIAAALEFGARVAGSATPATPAFEA